MRTCILHRKTASNRHVKQKTKERTSLSFVFLVGVTGFEPAASTSQTQKCRFFPYSIRLFGAFVSEINAFVCSFKHCFHVVRNRRWSTLWSESKLHIFTHLTRVVSSATRWLFCYCHYTIKPQTFQVPSRLNICTAVIKDYEPRRSMHILGYSKTRFMHIFG